MINSVYEHAYKGCLQGLNGKSKEAVKSYTKMYNLGMKNPTQAKYAIEEAARKANADYSATTTNSGWKTTYNTIKTIGRALIEYIFNPEYRKADIGFSKAYSKLYPKTHNARNAIIAERNMP